MGKNSKIQWTDHTWNPFYGCSKISAGCLNCYAERDMKRYGRDFGTVVKSKTKFTFPLSLSEPAKIFVCSWSDFFIPAADEWRDDAWEIIRQTPHLTYQILTKRPERVLELLPDDWGPDGWENVWMGVTAENQEMYDRRIPQLVAIPSVVRFISAEPLIGPITMGLGDTTNDLGHASPIELHECIDQVIVGGESGPRCRKMMPVWVTDLRDECVEYGVDFFFKQWGGKKTDKDGTWGGNLIEGRTWEEAPETRIF